MAHRVGVAYITKWLTNDRKYNKAELMQR